MHAAKDYDYMQATPLSVAAHCLWCVYDTRQHKRWLQRRHLFWALDINTSLRDNIHRYCVERRGKSKTMQQTGKKLPRRHSCMAAPRMSYSPSPGAHRIPEKLALSRWVYLAWEDDCEDNSGGHVRQASSKANSRQNCRGPQAWKKEPWAHNQI